MADALASGASVLRDVGFKSPSPTLSGTTQSHDLARVVTFVFGRPATAAEKRKVWRMVDDKTAHLQSEVNRIAALLNAWPIQAGVVLKDDDRNIYIDDDGRYHYDYWERGRQKVDHVGDIDEVLYWFACDIAFDIGGSYAARHRPRIRTRAS